MERKTWILCVLLCPFFLEGCAGKGMAPVVKAQGSFTNASLSGTYAFQATEDQNGLPLFLAGVLTTDGNGRIVSGREEVAVQGVLCEGTLTGTYSVAADGTGTVTLNQTFPLSSACVGTTTVLKIAIAAGGEKFEFVGSTLNFALVGTATKQ